MKKIYAIIILFAGITCSYAQSSLVGYEYWFNDDFANKTTTMIPSAQQLLINQTIPTTGLNQGLNALNIRTYDNSGKYSSVISQFFYKTSLPENNASPKIVAYEYWLNNDYSNAVFVNKPVQQQIDITELISMSSLNNGLNNFNIRFKDENDLWSSVIGSLFYKASGQIITQNTITEYRYWFDNDFANAINISLTPDQRINLKNLDLTHLPKGIYEINFQFKDTLGKWSVVIADSIEKASVPIADFSYTSAQDCDSSVITFADNSIDSDKYLWDFGDGNTSNLINPTHIYYTPGNYDVSLTVTDTILETDSTIVKSIVINSLHTASTITVTACGSFTAPDGQLYTTSGTKTAIVSNAAGCDSTITINLTINNVDVSVTQNGITLSANGSGANYQWLDCSNNYSLLNGETSQIIVLTQNGSYAVEVTQNNCVDTSACFTVTTVGILENTFSNDITVYPNPTNGIINIDLGAVSDEITVCIDDVSGKLISLSTHKNVRMFELNLTGEPGIYLLRINSKNKNATIRLIKN